MLENPLYMGYPAYRKKTTVNAVTSKKQPFDTWILPEKRVNDLVIVDEKIWYEAKRIRAGRNEGSNYNNGKENIKPRQTKSELLFIGMARCGECGYSFMTAGSKKKNKNGDIVKHSYYRCSSTRFTNTCGLEKKNIKKENVEEIVLKCVYNFLDSLGQIDLSKAIKKGVLNSCENEEKNLKKYEREIEETEANIKVLKDEVVKTLTGESSFTAELLNELITEKEEKKLQLLNLKSEIESKIEQKGLENQDILQIKDRIPVWKKEFEKADLDIKKMLLSEIIKEIRIFNNRYEIDFRLQLGEYLKEDKINNELKHRDSKLLEDTVSIKLEE